MAEFFVYARLRQNNRKTVIRVWDLNTPEEARQVVLKELDCRCALVLVPRDVPPPSSPLEAA